MVLLTLFMLCVIYWLLYSTFGENVNKQFMKNLQQTDSSSSSTTTTIKPFFYDIKHNNKNLTISSSSNGQWSFEIEDDYIFDENYKAIIEKDSCFGKPDNTKIKATGKKLYNYLRKNKINFGYNNNINNDNDYNNSVVQTYSSNNFNYYFSCRDNKINDVYTCPTGTLFKDGDCTSINICTGQKDGKTFPDSFDSHYYQICENEKPIRKRCQPESFFYFVDSCRSEYEEVDICNNNNNNTQKDSIFPISRKKYIRCLQNKQSIVEHCPEGTSILSSWDKCYPDHCIDSPEGFIKPMSSKTFGKFIYSPGYFVCGQNGKIKKVIHCTEKLWDFMKSNNNGGNLTYLPMVFDSRLNTCNIPSFCDNVQPLDKENTVVSPHEFTKYLRNWKHSPIYDSLVGYSCNDHSIKRFNLEPGKKIKDFSIVSACDDDPSSIHQKYPIADEMNKYFDCGEQKIVTCEENEMFSMEHNGCVKIIKNAHKFKNIPFFRLSGLSPWNNWIKPFGKLIPAPFNNNKTCSYPETEYLETYNVCSHPDCTNFPFLKQNPELFILLPDGKKYCKLNKMGKISKKSYFMEDNLNFWSQRLYAGDKETENCVPGQKIRSGNFLFDSTLFATCNMDQPFVFCPSSSTKGISRLPDRNIWACEPNDDVLVGEIPADTIVKLSSREISFIKPEFDAAYRINNGKIQYFIGGSVTYSDGKFEYWSDKKSQIVYQTLANYPVNTFIKDGFLKHGGNRNEAYLVKNGKNVSYAITLEEHVEEENI